MTLQDVAVRLNVLGGQVGRTMKYSTHWVETDRYRQWAREIRALEMAVREVSGQIEALALEGLGRDRT